MIFDDILVRSNKPYPEIEGAVDCRRTVAILRNLATARHSELSTILQYTFQSIEADQVIEEVGKVLEEIGVVEMMHLDMLMHAIRDFGGSPRYEDSQGQMYNTSGVNYSTKLKDIIEIDIRDENIAIEEYKRAINMVNNESLKQLFARIIEDEEMHIEALKKVRDNVTFLSL